MAEDAQQVLIVEDDPSVAKVLKTRLGTVGYGVHVEPCGSTALRYAAEHRPDLVVLDLRLPDLGGYEVCRQLRRLYQPWSVPVLMLTAMDRPIDQLRGFAHGADAYLTKPYSSDELLQTVELLLGQSVST